MCLNLYCRSSSNFPSRFPKVSRYALMEPCSFSRPKIVLAFSTVARIFFSFRTIPGFSINDLTSRSDRLATFLGEKSAKAFRKLGHFFSIMLQFNPAVKIARDIRSKYPWSSLGGVAFHEGAMSLASLSFLFSVNFVSRARGSSVPRLVGIPAQDSQGTECVPAARRSSPTFHVEVDLALMGLSERPSPVLVSTPCHHFDGFVGPFIGLHARLSQVVQTPEDVVMPPSRKRKSCPARSMIFPVAIDDLSG